MDFLTGSIKNYFKDLSVVHFSGDQRQKVDKFLSSSSLSSLVVVRDSKASNGIRVLFPDELSNNGNSNSSNDTIVVFVKVASSTPSSEPRIISDSQLLQELREEIAESKASNSGVLNILSRLHKHADVPSVIQALQSERKEILPRVTDWAEESLTIDNREDKETVELITLLKAKERKVKAVIKVCEGVLSDIPGFPEAKKNLIQVASELTNESSRLFREWTQECESAAVFDKNRPCIEIDSKSQEPFVTFDYALVKMTRECKMLRCFGYSIPDSLQIRERQVRDYGNIARELREIVSFYCTVGDHILASQRPIMIDSAKKFTSLLESKDARITWDREPDKLGIWLDQLKDFSNRFNHQNKFLRSRHYSILKLVLKLFDIPVLKWRPTIHEIRMSVQDVDDKFTNTLSWKLHWDHQLYKVLEYHFNDSLLKPDAWLGSGKSDFSVIPSTSMTPDSQAFHVDLCFVSGSITYRPPIEEIKSKIFARVRKFLSMPSSFTGVADSKRKGESIFAAIYARSFESLPFLYSKAVEIIKELQHVSQRFDVWVAMHGILSSYSNNTAGLAVALELNTVDDYKRNLVLLKNRTQKFKKEYMENEVSCESASIVINLVPIKTIIEHLLSETDKLIVKTLKDRTEAEARDLKRETSTILEKLEHQPKTVAEMKELEDLITKQLPKFLSTLESRYSDIQAKSSFLKTWSAKSAPDIQEVASMIDELEGLFKSQEKVLKSFQDILKHGLENNMASLTARASIIEKKWNAAPSDVKSTQEFVAEVKQEIEELLPDFEEVRSGCDYFSREEPESFTRFASLIEQVKDIDSKLSILSEFDSGIKHYMDMEWLICRNKLSPIEHYISRWEDDHPVLKADSSSFSVINDRIREWKEMIPILKICRGECFAKNHWSSFISQLDFPPEITYENVTLRMLVSRRETLVKEKDFLRDLNARAAGETSVRETFNELDDFAATAKFSLYDYDKADGTTTKLIKDWRTILNSISESILTLQSVKSSDFFSNEFAEKGDQWESRLITLDGLINNLNTVQRKWAYLEPIFSNSNNQAFSRDQTFVTISREFLDIMKSITSDPHVIRVLRFANLSGKLKEIESVLMSCQKKLAVFMEESRNRFPRFYFLADDDLLLVLAGKTEISEVGLLKKLFNNCLVRLHFKSLDKKIITAVESPEGEVVTLLQEVSTQTPQVESWLLNLESEIRSSLRQRLFDIIREGRDVMREPLKSWEKIPSQVISMSKWISFTRKTEEAIRGKRLREVKNEFEEELAQLTSFNLEQESPVTKIKVRCLILDTIHFLSVVDDLLESPSPRSVDDFKWKKHLRYYFTDEGLDGRTNKKDTLMICMQDGRQEYSFEYLGCYGSCKLVHTPLTDRCYATCMQGKTDLFFLIFSADMSLASFGDKLPVDQKKSKRTTVIPFIGNSSITQFLYLFIPVTHSVTNSK